jgi:hypothetical protein
MSWVAFAPAVICSPIGRRSRSYVSRICGSANPLTTAASFHPRLNASCMHPFMPCPPAGEWTWEASPHSSTLPSR